MIEIIVLASFLFYVWTFIGYPVTLAILPKNPPTKGDIYLSVSMVVAAYNEENTIEDKIKNSLDLDYPKEKLEIIVVESGSTDRTPEIVKEYKDVKLLQQKERRGKAAAINFGKENAGGEIVIITDSNALFEKETVKRLISNFADSKVGGVVGNYVISNPSSSFTSRGEDFYFKIERFMRDMEGQIDSTVTFSGEITAFRKELIGKVREDSISEDMSMALAIRKKDYRVVYEPEAKVFEKGAETTEDEMIKRKRTAIGTIQECFRNKDLFFNPRYGLFGTLILPSHKLFQIITPFVGIGFVVSSFIFAYFNRSTLPLILILMVSLYLLASFVITILKMRIYKGGFVRLFVNSLKILPFFIFMQWIVFRAWIDYIRGEYSVKWQLARSTR
jgi:cellulose synthase/poly-beta-1,6-N-acetylglucosamine synthase-like glycosyltransferase